MKRITMYGIICGLTISFGVYGQQARTLTFEEAVNIGLKRNVVLNQQKNQMMVNQAQKLNNLGNFLPNLNVTGQFQRQEGQQQNTTSGNLEDLKTNYAGLQLNANLTIFGGLRNVNSLSQSNNQLTAQGYLVKRSTQDVVSFVANQYLQVVLDQELLKIAEENLATQKALFDQIQGFFDVGSRAITEVYNQDALMKTAQVSSIRARSTLQNDKAILSQTLQLEPSEAFEVVYPEFRDDVKVLSGISFDSLFQVAKGNRSDLKQIYHQVEANKFLWRSSSSGFMPNVSLFANYGSFYYSLIQQNFEQQFIKFNPSLSYGVNMTVPIFSRFQSKSTRTQSRVTYDNSVLNKQNLEQTVKIDVQRAYNNLMNAIENYESSLAQYQAGELALQAQRESYDLGISDFVALAQANQTYVLGAASKAQAEVTLLFQHILLDYALGTLQTDQFEQN